MAPQVHINMVPMRAEAARNVGTTNERMSDWTSGTSSAAHAQTTARRTHAAGDGQEMRPPAKSYRVAEDVEDFVVALMRRLAFTPDKETVARILNSVRYNPMNPAHRKGGVPTEEQLRAEVTPRIVKEVLAAVAGITPNEVDAMSAVARKGGMWIPTSNTAFNTLNYGVVPFVGHAFGLSLPVQIYMNLALLAAQPAVTAILQSMIVKAIDFSREKSAAAVKLDKSAVNAEETAEEIDKSLGPLLNQVDEKRENLRKAFDHVYVTHGLEDPTIDCDQSKWEEYLEKLPAADQQRVMDAYDASIEAEVAFAHRAVDLQAVTGLEARQIRSGTNQEWSRTFRGGASVPTAVGRAEVQKIPTRFPPIAQIGMTAAFALGCMAWQHYGASRDEAVVMMMELILNILHADILTKKGKAAWDRGEELQPEDIADDCGKIVKTPEEAVWDAAISSLRRDLENLKARIDEGGSSAGAEAAAGDLEAQSAPVQGNAITRRLPPILGGVATPEQRRKCAELESSLARVEADPRALSGLSADDPVRKRFAQVLSPGFDNWAFVATEGWHKAWSPGEFESQSSQRAGQIFLGGVMGTAGAIVLGKAITAAIGAEKIPLEVILLLSLLGAASGFIGAKTQWRPVMVKNMKRDTIASNNAKIKEAAAGELPAPHLKPVQGWWSQTVDGAMTPLLLAWWATLGSNYNESARRKLEHGFVEIDSKRLVPSNLVNPREREEVFGLAATLREQGERPVRPS